MKRLVTSLYVSFVWLSFLLGSGSAQAEPSLTLEVSQKQIEQLSRAERQKLRDFLSETLEAVPMKVRRSLGRVTIKLAKLDSNREIIPPSCTDIPQLVSQLKEGIQTGNQESGSRQVLGFTMGGSREAGTIRINRNFLREILAGPQGARSFSCKHRNLFAEAKATVLHELMHLYDNLNLPATNDPQEKAIRQRCEAPAIDGDGGGPPADCESAPRFLKTVSDRPEFEAAVGSRNEIGLRSPDPYEGKALSELFAVNMEYFLLDPEYKCRRPHLYRMLSHHFGEAPQAAENSSCVLNTKIFFSDFSGEADLDPSRIYQVHYLHTGPGKTSASRFGHSMIRLIRCAPERKELSEKCLEDLSQHVVLSFRASVDGTQGTSTLKGLTGGYPSVLYVMRMNPVINEYTVEEPRNLFSYPIRFSRDELEAFIEKTLELFWEYRGKYYFFTNNCAAETLKLIQASYARPVLWNKQYWLISPKNVLDELANSSAIDVSAVSARGSSSRYVFEARVKKHQQAFQELKGLEGIPKSLKLADYLASPPEKRRLWITASLASLEMTNRRALQAQTARKFLMLELGIYREVNQRLNSELFQLLNDDRRFLDQSKPLIEEYRRILAISAPWAFTTNGYGVPLTSERRAFDEMSSFKRDSERLLQRFTEDTKNYFPDTRSELNSIQENLALLLSAGV